MSVTRVALLIETSTSWGSQIVRGIADFAHTQGDWLFFLEPRGRYESLKLPRHWTGEGIIARVTTTSLAEQIVNSGIPAVNVSWYTHGDRQIPRCTVDERLAGRLAADHFFNLGFRHFAYCGSTRRPGYVDRLRQAFADALGQAGRDCVFYEPPPSDERPTWEETLKHLSHWLRELPKPSAVLAFSDVIGRQLTEACHYAEIAVPDDVAVLGGEHDVLSSEVSLPTLSSIDLSAERVGREAAALLARLMSGEPAPELPVLLPPAGIIARQSTDTLAIDDTELVEALRFIRTHGRDAIHVRDLLGVVPVSRRVLEQRFQRILGRSPAAEIRRVRIQWAKEMLSDTELPMPRIAADCGFEHAEVMTRVFRREVGMTPTAYRKQFRH